jgi:hypothetical protein
LARVRGGRNDDARSAKTIMTAASRAQLAAVPAGTAGAGAVWVMSAKEVLGMALATTSALQSPGCMPAGRTTCRVEDVLLQMPLVSDVVA